MVEETVTSVTLPETEHVYHWVVLYEDGFPYGELGGEGEPRRGWASVDLARVRWVCLQAAAPGLPGHAVHVDLEAGERAFFTRRITHTVNPNTDPPVAVGPPTVVFLIGVRRPDGTHALLYVTEAGLVTGSTNLNLAAA